MNIFEESYLANKQLSEGLNKNIINESGDYSEGTKYLLADMGDTKKFAEDLIEKTGGFNDIELDLQNNHLNGLIRVADTVFTIEFNTDEDDLLFDKDKRMSLFIDISAKDLGNPSDTLDELKNMFDLSDYRIYDTEEEAD